ncbi:MAG: hypothetical protein ACFFEY_10105 [Candidatus Thorarchaeota archaeon]
MQLLKIGANGELVKLERLDFEENDVYLVDDEERNTIYIWVGNEVNQAKKDITADIARKLDKEHGGSAKILIMKQKREYGSFLAMMHDLKKGLIPGKTIERRPEFVFTTPPESIRSIGLDGIAKTREIPVEVRINQWLNQIKAHRKIKLDEKYKETTDTIKFVKFDRRPLIMEKKIEIKNVSKQEPVVIEEFPEEIDFEAYTREAAYYLSLKGYTYDELCWLLAEKIQKMNLDMPSIADIKRKAEEVFNSSCTYDELSWLNAEIDTLTKRRLIEKKKNYKY